jgi:tRNA (cmo5U34)-methyltransferase
MKTDKQRSEWETGELAKTFLEGVRGAIPGAGFQLEVLNKIVSMWSPVPSRILDLGCGDGILGRMLLDAHASARVIFADFSEPMLEACRKLIGSNQRATLVKADFSTPAWLNGLDAERPFDVVVSGFAIHHQADDRKRELYAEIYGLLREGGIFLNLEHVSSASPSGSALFDSYFVDGLERFHEKAGSGRTRREIEQTFYERPDKKENILAPVERQCQWLRDMGFQDVDCFFKVFELALFGGRKASGKSLKPTADKAGCS